MPVFQDDFVNHMGLCTPCGDRKMFLSNKANTVQFTSMHARAHTRTHLQNLFTSTRPGDGFSPMITPSPGLIRKSQKDEQRRGS